MKTTTNLLLLTLFLLLFSCKDNASLGVDLLTQAQNVIESKPGKALMLLDSIKKPEEMGKEKHMEYIVARVQAKYKTYQDITGDTLIFEAQKYFEEKKDASKKALTNFYVGAVFREKGMEDKALEYFLKANKNAIETNSYLLAAKSEHNIGNIYFICDVMDTAIVRYKEALVYYDKEKNTDIYKLQVLDLLGRSTFVINQLDSALLYYKQGFDLATLTNNTNYQSVFNQRLGVLYRQKKDYKKASSYLHKALATTTDGEKTLLIHLNLSKLYNSTSQLDSAKHYTDLIKTRLSEVKDDYVLRSIYGALADFNKQQGNYREALQYSDLEKYINQKITQADNSLKLLKVENNYKLSLKEMSALKLRLYLYMAIAVLVALIVAFMGYLKNKNVKHKQQQQDEKNKLLATQNTLLETQNTLLNKKVESMTFLQGIYQNIINDWTEIDGEILKMAEEYGAKEKPAIFVRIEEIFKSIKSKTNLQFTQRAKEWLLEQPYGEKAVKILSERDMLILILHQHRYTLKEISNIIGLKPNKRNMYMRKLDIRNKLEVAGMPMDEIYDILFPNGEQ